MNNMTPWKEDLLKFVGDNECCDVLWWFGNLKFMTNANDLFYWACADAEEITEENLPVFKQAILDCGYDSDAGALLFPCRVRKMRPQGAYYKQINKKLHHLFDACGPARPADSLNPIGRE